MGLGSQLKHAWSAFTSKEERVPLQGSFGSPTSYRPERPRPMLSAERTIINSIYTRMSIDVAAIRIEHCRVDENGMYLETIQSGLNNCLNVEGNLDQGARHLRQDIALTLFTSGVAAIAPIDTTLDPILSGSWDVKTLRVGTVVSWEPQHVTVRLYDERTAQYRDLRLPKRIVAIVENPFYSVMNEPNSTLQRLIKKLSLLDNVDEISSQGKLDIIIQLPYVVKSDLRKEQALKRTREIQDQLQGSTYGIAYAEATEKITQLNRSVENNLLEQVKYLREELYAELGITAEVINGTADDVVMLNYINRTIEPIMDAIVEAMARKFLTKTARSQGQTLKYFDAPFRLLPIGKLAEVVDALSRNQIVTPNEMRPVLGLKPSTQPQANALVNSNMPLSEQISGEEEAAVNPADELEAELDAQMAELELS